HLLPPQLGYKPGSRGSWSIFGCRAVVSIQLPSTRIGAHSLGCHLGANATRRLSVRCAMSVKCRPTETAPDRRLRAGVSRALRAVGNPGHSRAGRRLGRMFMQRRRWRECAAADGANRGVPWLPALDLDESVVAIGAPGLAGGVEVGDRGRVQTGD